MAPQDGGSLHLLHLRAQVLHDRRGPRPSDRRGSEDGAAAPEEGRLLRGARAARRGRAGPPQIFAYRMSKNVFNGAPSYIAHH